ncbi:guanosine-3',5'-bis(diphosphate) 3'-pyrophosphohydrolase [Salmonella bongori]|nr:guanosine-3',5'-bis(diphosphate) 3'-pyrophosphohydrolase [Salmonella bongori]
MKLATLDDLLAEIGLGNAMSVVVAKKSAARRSRGADRCAIESWPPAD